MLRHLSQEQLLMPQEETELMVAKTVPLTGKMQMLKRRNLQEPHLELKTQTLRMTDMEFKMQRVAMSKIRSRKLRATLRTWQLALASFLPRCRRTPPLGLPRLAARAASF